MSLSWFPSTRSVWRLVSGQDTLVAKSEVYFQQGSTLKERSTRRRIQALTIVKGGITDPVQSTALAPRTDCSLSQVCSP